MHQHGTGLAARQRDGNSMALRWHPMPGHCEPIEIGVCPWAWIVENSMIGHTHRIASYIAETGHLPTQRSSYLQYTYTYT
eukprot:819732-Karenia_brevis.AAC.1